MLEKFVLGAFLLIPLFIIGCHQTTNSFENTRFLLGTAVTIKAYGAEAKLAVSRGFDKMEELELEFDQYSENGVVFGVNEFFSKESNGTAGFMEISNDLCNVVRLGLKYGSKTDGKYDITIGPLTSYWKNQEHENTLPIQKEINELKKLINYEKVQLNIEKNLLRIEAGMELDFGGVAKGYIVEQVMLYMEKYNTKGIIINAGGNVLTSGENGVGSWEIAVVDPSKIDELLGLISFKEKGAVVSSGNYQQYYLIKENKYGHILNIETGWPATGVLGATVFGENSAEADILATSAVLLGVEGGLALIENSGYEGIIVDQSGELYKTKDMNKYFKPSNFKVK
ncbi:MAG: FAD:protein FMN transferase [Bacillota bacterium]